MAQDTNHMKTVCVSTHKSYLYLWKRKNIFLDTLKCPWLGLKIELTKT